MKAIILAAGVGLRLGGDDAPPKVLLAFGGRTLLQRHLDNLARCGIDEVIVALGHGARSVEAEIDRLGARERVRTTLNPDYREGSIVTLWTVREWLGQGEVILMDADVLYDHRLLQRLTESAHRNCFLLDRDLEPGDEPVKLCVRDGVLVEFRKRIDVAYDWCGESVGFFRLSGDTAGRLVAAARPYIEAGRRSEYYDEPLRDLLLGDPPGSFGFEDVTGLPWIEIDVAEDVRRAEADVLPRLVDES